MGRGEANGNMHSGQLRRWPLEKGELALTDLLF